MVLSRKVTEFSTASTCNCLLSGGLPARWGKFDIVVGCYELLRSAALPLRQQEEEGQGSVHVGALAGIACGRREDERVCRNMELRVPPGPLPGIFDLVHSRSGNCLMASCTDGALWTLELQDGGALHATVFPVFDTMLTSCSPLCGSTPPESKWLCTAHRGDVALYDAEVSTVVARLDGHEYDAWCSAATGCETGATGGDDGLMRWHDVRTGGKLSVAKMQFNAGVISISPVSTCGASATTYSLVGSYDEHLYLVDVRSAKRPLASVHVGGGAWRCSRQLLEEKLTPEAKSAMHHYRWVQECNALAIPVMQGGVALVRYNVAADVRGSFTLLGHLHSSAGSEPCGGELPDNSLFYDCAVVPGDCGAGAYAADGGGRTVAACDFYNRTVSLWSIEGI